jgi:hypothetical protein
MGQFLFLPGEALDAGLMKETRHPAKRLRNVNAEIRMASWILRIS